MVKLTNNIKSDQDLPIEAVYRGMEVKFFREAVTVIGKFRKSENLPEYAYKELRYPAKLYR